MRIPSTTTALMPVGACGSVAASLSCCSNVVHLSSSGVEFCLVIRILFRSRWFERGTESYDPPSNTVGFNCTCCHCAGAFCGGTPAERMHKYKPTVGTP